MEEVIIERPAGHYSANINEEDEDWDIVIAPKENLLQFHFSDVWRYRDLLWLFVKRDFAAQYKQTVLGPIWHVVQPLLTTAMFLIVFFRIAKIPTEGVPPVLFYLSGLTVWNYFSACLTNTSNTFVANAGIFGKVYFPRIIIPLSVVASNMARLGIQMVLLMAIFVYTYSTGYRPGITMHLLWVPVIIILLAGIGLGLGLIISSLTTKYRDFTVLISFGVQLLLYLSPVVYPLSYLEGTRYYNWIKWNPVSPLIEGFRFALFQTGQFHFQYILYSSACMMILVITGLIIFNKVEKTFMDTV